MEEKTDTTSLQFMNHLRLARAYIPWQRYTRKYPLAEALRKGTLYPELWFPYQRNRY